jgi:hypothetical protein
MKLKQYLTELAMKSGTTIDVKKKRGFEYNAKIGLKDGTHWFFNAVNDPGEDNWNISFWQSELAGPQEIKDKRKAGLQLFAAIEKLMHDFIKWGKPEYFYFTGTGTSRVKLYNTLAKKILKDGKYEKGNVPVLLQGAMWNFVRK